MSDPAGGAGSATIAWFRLDLRIEDNSALAAAVRRGGPVIPVYVWAPEEEGEAAPGGASRVWLEDSLRALNDTLEARGSRLILRPGDTLAQLRAIAKETGATAVFWNRRYEPSVIERDKTVKEALRKDGIEAESFNAALMFEPWDIETKQGGPYQVFTPFWKRCQEVYAIPEAETAPKSLEAPKTWPASAELASFELAPAMAWVDELRSYNDAGEVAARAQIETFIDERVADYASGRDTPGEAKTSRLSPHLHFGEIGPWQICRALEERGATAEHEKAAYAYIRELGWREFAYHLLFHFPDTVSKPLRENFAKFPWRDDPESLKAWQRGRTGYPIVDAGMRELWATGWMHNRVRMIVASFLTKDLLIPWQDGAAWFWDTLVDGDLASNTLGWQWTAGCGADAAPYFRIFNPVTQGGKFDGDGQYVRRWVPELAALPNTYIHRPWEAPAETLREAGVTLGETYPQPIVDHKVARNRALEAYEAIK